MVKELLNKTKDIPQGVKASFAYFLASVFSKGISYIVTPLYTRLMTAGEYGQVSVYMTWLEVFGIIAMFCLSYGVFNSGMVDYPDKRDEYSFSMLILSNIITLCFSAIFLALYPIIKSIIKMDFPLAVLMCVIFFFQPAYNFWVTKQRYELKYKYTFIVSVVSAVFSPLVAVLLLWKGNGNAVYERIFGAEAILILIYIFFYIFILVRGKARVNIKYWKFALLFNLPLLPHYLSMYLLSSSDKIMIQHLVSDEATAYYSVAHSIAAIALVVWTAINGSLIPYSYEKLKIKDYNSISRVTMPILLLFAAACVGVIMLAPEAVRIIATNDYMEAIYVIPPIVAGVFFQVQYHVYSNAVYFYKKPIYVMFASVSAMVLNIALNYFGIKKFGYIAAGYTTLISYAVQAGIDYLAMRKVAKCDIYNMKFMALMSVSVVAIALICNLFYNIAWIRYSILGLLVVIAIFFRRKIFEMISFMFKKNKKEEVSEENKESFQENKE